MIERSDLVSEKEKAAIAEVSQKSLGELDTSNVSDLSDDEIFKLAADAINALDFFNLHELSPKLKGELLVLFTGKLMLNLEKEDPQ